MTDLIKSKVLELNASLPLGYLHPFGRGVGLCAEFNNNVRTFINCISNGIGFNHQAVSRPVGLAVKSGWADYFVPHVPTIANKFALLNSVSLAHRNYKLLRPLARAVLHSETKCSQFAFDPINQARPKHVSIKPLNYEADFDKAMSDFTNIFWDLADDTKVFVENMKGLLTAGACDVAVHIRRGDKNTEFEYVPVEAYIAALKKVEGIAKSVYIASDDPRTALQLREMICDRFSIVSTSVKILDDSGRTENGYDQNSFNSLSLQTRLRQTREMMAEIEIMREAETFIGASTSNVFFTVRRLRRRYNVIDLAEGAWQDREKWRRF